MTFVLDKAHDEEWIKEEMERRLWLCEMWFQHLDEGKSELYETLQEVVDYSLKEFLNYREKYYKKNAEKEKRALSVNFEQKKRI